ncbi:hypothetical protein FLAVO9AF_120047 [Flavobacterium sp. 9AF]|nr:hypothetical protein FLAVO9AF_120047 [Flavobacterium sp. 9AF]
MTLPGRTYSSPAYRYGFQGQEKDDELKGEGNSLNYTFRMHDPRVGRFFATDPLEKKYPWYTPYQFSGNRLIDSIELEGLEEHQLSNGSGTVYGPWISAEAGALNGGTINLPEITVYGGSSQNNFTDLMSNFSLSGYGYGCEWMKPYDFNNFENKLVPLPLAVPYTVYTYGGQGDLEYLDELLAGLSENFKGLSKKGGYVVLSTAKYGNGFYWKPNMRGLHNLKGFYFNGTTGYGFAAKGTNWGSWGVSAALEVPEIYYGYQTNTHEGNKQVAGAVGNLGGGWLGGAIAGGTLGLLGIKTGPGVIVTVFVGAVVGSAVGEEKMEEIYEDLSKPKSGTVKGTFTTAMPVW